MQNLRHVRRQHEWAYSFCLHSEHAVLRITGTTESGEAIQRTFGFMPREGSAFMVLGDRVQGAIIDEAVTATT